MLGGAAATFDGDVVGQRSESNMAHEARSSASNVGERTIDRLYDEVNVNRTSDQRQKSLVGIDQCADASGVFSSVELGNSPVRYTREARALGLDDHGSTERGEQARQPRRFR